MKPVTKDELSTQYMPWYVRDYLEDHDILVLSCAAEGARARLVTVQWLKGILPLSPDVLRVLSRATADEWPAMWAQLESHFPVTEDGTGRRNPGVHALFLNRVAYLQTKRSNGAKGGRRKATGNPPDSRSDNQADNQTPNHSVNRPANHQGNRPDNRAVYQSVNHPDNQAVNRALNQSPHHPANQNESGSEAQPNQSETVVVGVVVEPLSPPPSGGGAFPTPTQAGGFRDADDSAPADSPGAEATSSGHPLHDELTATLAAIPDADARAAVARLFTEQHIPPLRWASWIKRFTDWTTGKGRVGNQALSWEAIGIGLSDLLDVNPAGQRITPQSVEGFVANMQRARDLAAAEPNPLADTESTAPLRHVPESIARQEAEAGDPEWQAYCRDHGITYAEGVA